MAAIDGDVALELGLRIVVQDLIGEMDEAELAVIVIPILAGWRPLCPPHKRSLEIPLLPHQERVAGRRS